MVMSPARLTSSGRLPLSRLQVRILIVALVLAISYAFTSTSISTHISHNLPISTNLGSLPNALGSFGLSGDKTTRSVIPLDPALVQSTDRQYLFSVSPLSSLHSSDTPDTGTIHVVLPSLDAAAELQPLICNLKWTGHAVQVIVTAPGGIIESGLCEISYTILSSNLQGSLSELWSETPDVVFVATIDVTSDLYHITTSLLPLRPILIPLNPRGGEGELWDWAGTLSLSSLQHISVIGNDRPDSLRRLMTSISAAHYLGDTVNVAFSLERTATRPTHALVKDFIWDHGTITVRHRVKQGGLIPQIIESWYPKNDDSYGVILEDDIEVSPMFYAWAKWAILKYRYDKSERTRSRGLYGISLYQQNHSEMQLKGPRRLPFDARKVIEAEGITRSSPYLSQIPCSWGAVFFPEIWREFHSYLPLRQAGVGRDTNADIIPAIRTNGWKTSWKRFINELIYLRGYSMLYPNYDDWLAFSTNHFEPGEHHKIETPEEIAFHNEQLKYFEVPLYPGDLSLMRRGMPNGTMPNWSDLPVLDFWGKARSEKSLRDSGRTRYLELFPDQPPPTLDGERPWQDGFLGSSLLCRPDDTRTGCGL